MQGIGDAGLAKALDEGDWDAPMGEYYDTWDEDKHVIPDFTPPDHWPKFRTFDWGSAEPFFVTWWTIADGEDIKAQDGSTFWVPSGSLIAYREWNGCNTSYPEKGLGLSNQQIAHGILERTKEKNPLPWITVTDSFPFAGRGEADISGKKHTMSDTFAEYGVPLTRANTARGQGGGQVKDRLQGIESIPLLYVVAGCFYLRDYIPALPRDPHDPELPAEHGEASHACDNVRYAATARMLPRSRPDPAKQNPLTPKGILNKMKPKRISLK